MTQEQLTTLLVTLPGLLLVAAFAAYEGFKFWHDCKVQRPAIRVRVRKDRRQ